MITKLTAITPEYMKHRIEEETEQYKEEKERLNNIIENIDTYIHLWKLEEIGEKTMLILNDILLIKNGMSDEVIRLKEVNKECMNYGQEKEQ